MLLNPRVVLVSVVMSVCVFFNGSDLTLASTPTTTLVNLTAVANVEAIAPNGTTVAHGGLDAHGNAYSSGLTGTSLTWSGATFSLGEAGALDAVSGQTIPLPAGQYSTLKLLATGCDGDQPDQSFIVTYSDGTTSTITQSVSDWRTPQDYAGESTAVTYPYRVTETGALHYNTYHVYGYSFNINSSKTVHSLTLPNNRHVVVLSVGLVSNAAATSVSSTAATSVTGLHVAGNQILNSQDQTVTLHGVDKSGTEYECLGGPLVFDGPSDAASVTALKTWAINIVRLPINEDCWLGINGVAVGGTTYRTAIVNYVNLLTAGNIATIIDLQWAAPGTTLSNQLTPMPDADHAPSFWTSVATTFKGNSSVIFDLFNEPYPDSNNDSTAAWSCLKNGGSCPGVSYTAVGTQSLVATIRATGSTNIIMVPGIQYTNVLDQWLAYKPADPLDNVAASWHSYAGQICDNSGCWTSEIQPVLVSVPLIAGEIGENDCADTYIDPLMTFLDSHGGSYLAWGWNTYDCSSFPSLISDYSGTPTAFGVGFYDHMLALKGQTAAAPASVAVSEAPTSSVSR